MKSLLFLLRAAARNFKNVIPLCDPDDYQQAIDLWSRIFLIDVTNEPASEVRPAIEVKVRLPLAAIA